MTNIADYIQDNYGECVKEPCDCRNSKTNKYGGRWVGRVCPNWKSSGVRNWEELLKWQKGKINERKRN